MVYLARETPNACSSPSQAALVADEDVSLGSHFAQGLAHPRHGHDILGLENDLSAGAKLAGSGP